MAAEFHDEETRVLSHDPAGKATHARTATTRRHAVQLSSLIAPATSAGAQMCRLCAIGKSSDVWDQVLWETETFRVVPSKGGFIKGWLMVVPKVHVFSMAHLDASTGKELEAVVAIASARIAARFGAPTAFEHGATSVNTSFGCGIDHAHLHLVPLPSHVHLRQLAEAALGELFRPLEPRRGFSYLRVREPADETFFLLEPTAAPPRQFFRQIIWRECPWLAATYDYDLSPCHEQVRATIGILERV